MLLAEKVLALLGALGHRSGKAWATERAKRTMMGSKWGKAPGERSISRVERALATKGRLRRRRVMPGGRLPNGFTTRRGTVIVELVSRQEQRAIARAARKAAARAPSPPPSTAPRPPPVVRPSPAPAVDGARPLTLEELARVRADLAAVLGTGPPRR